MLGIDRKEKLITVVALALLGVFVLQVLLNASDQSPTLDEQNHIARGYAYLRTGDLRLSREHPPLVNAISALPWLVLRPQLPTEQPAWDSANWYAFADELLWQATDAAGQPVEAQKLVNWARLPILLLGLVLGMGVYVWAAEMYGSMAGLVALALYVFSPNILAHSRLATNDLGLACFMFLALYTFWRFMTGPSALGALLAGLALGLALAAKFSALVLLPIVGLLVVLRAWRRRPQSGRAPAPSQEELAAIKQAAVVGLPVGAELHRPRPINSAAWPWWRNLEWKWVAYGALIVAVGLLALWGVYGLQRGPLSEGGPSLPMPAYWHGLEAILARAERGNPAFLMGEYSTTGWWYYFPLALTIKTPLPTLLLLAAALVLTIRRRSWRAEMWLLLPVAVYLLGLLVSALNIGYRHLLPLLPLLFVYVSKIAICKSPGLIRRLQNLMVNLGMGQSQLADSRLQIADSNLQVANRQSQPANGAESTCKSCKAICKWVRVNLQISISSLQIFVFSLQYVILSFLILWQACSALSIQPYYLAYFNELVGGPENGYRYLVDSNLDWGQDLPALRDYMTAQGVEQVYLSWFGPARPERYGIRYSPLPGFPRYQGSAETFAFNPYQPAPGFYAISATNLQGVPLIERDTFAWFRDQEPLAQPGYSILIYRVAEPQGLPNSVAIGGVSYRQVATETLQATLAQPNTRLRAFAPQAGFIAPVTGETTYIVSDLLPFAPTLRQKLLAQARVLGRSQDYTIYRLDASLTLAAEASMLAAVNTVWWSPAVDFAVGDPEALRHQLTLPVGLRREGDALALIGYDGPPAQAAPGDALALTTYWRVLGPAPLSTTFFIHLLDIHSQVWAGWDGLDVSPYGWQRGDVVVQHSQLSVPTDAPPGEYQVEIGVYTAADERRFTVVEGEQEVADRLLLRPIQVGSQ